MSVHDVPETMKAAVFHGRRDVRIEEVPTPLPGAGQLLLRVRVAGVCGTDAAEWDRGPNVYASSRVSTSDGDGWMLIPGHELAGEVVSDGGGVEGFRSGDLVACGAGYVTGEDRLTSIGRPYLSRWYETVGLQADGGFAQYCVVPASSCVPVGSTLTPDATALAQPTAVAVHAARRGRLQSGERAVVLGIGGIGAFLVAAAKHLGAAVTAIDLDPSRLEIARTLGADQAIPAGSSEEVATIDDADVVFEATGTEAGLALALQIAGSGSRIVIVGLQRAPREVDLRLLAQRELELLGTNAHHCEIDLPLALELLAARTHGWGDVAPRAIPLEDLVSEGLAPLAERRAAHVKTLVDPWATASRPTDTASPGG